VLHGALLDAARNATLMLNREVVGLSLFDGGVEARLADGTGVRGRLLVGADGINSIVRRQLHPGEPPMRASGLFGLRGVAHDVAHLMEGASGAQYFGKGVEAGLGRAGGTTVYWYLSLPHEVATAGSMEPAKVLERGLEGFDHRFRTIALATRPGDVRLDELFDREPMPNWGRGALTLLGDAAHPMLPHAGQGAAQALEDAVTLGRQVDGRRQPEAALREYERLRSARTSAVVRLARRNARLGSLQHPLACQLRDLMIRAIPERVILKSLVALGRPSEQ
jgi:2-polyprenyl-6-methoxyphenol hydroxylase-like FAD-dependent oxidoreductase